MAYEFKKSTVTGLFKRDNGCYYGKCKVFGRCHKKSFGEVSLDEAKRLLQEWQAELRGEVVCNRDTAIQTLGQCLDVVEKEALSGNISDAHRTFLKNRCKFIRDNWARACQIQPAEIGTSAILEWIERLKKDGYSTATLRGTLLYLRKAFTYATDGGLCVENPMRNIKPPTPQRDASNAKHQLSTTDFDRILAEMRNKCGHNAAKAADTSDLLAATGARISELVGGNGLPGLRWKDVDWKNNQVTLRTAKGRVAKANVGTMRIIPFHPRLVAALQRLKGPGDTKKPDALVAPTKQARRSLQGACKRLFDKGELSITRLTHHDLRHLFTTWCIEAGIDVPTVADLLGHRDGGALLLRTYRHLRTEHLHNQVKKLETLAADAPRPLADYTAGATVDHDRAQLHDQPPTGESPRPHRRPGVEGHVHSPHTRPKRARPGRR